MEPLSLATGILTVLAATGSTVKGLEKLSSLRTAGKDLLSVMNEVWTMLMHAENAKLVSLLL